MRETMPYLSCGNSTVQSPNQFVQMFFHHDRESAGAVDLSPSVQWQYRTRRRSCQRIERPKSQRLNDPEGGFGTACFLSISIETTICWSLRLSFSCLSLSACDKDSRLEPRVHIPLKVPLQVLVCGILFFYLLMYISISIGLFLRPFRVVGHV